MKTNLHNLKCSSCSGKTLKLDNMNINLNLKLLNNWNINQERSMIFKKFVFKNFKNSLQFANNIGAIAEKEMHHPDLSIGYNYCLTMIYTHAIQGLSINDFILASKIDLISK